MHRPSISILTPSFQQADHLEACLRSVHDQHYPQLEHVVIDGGSTDGSCEIIERYGDKLKWWCCEKDQGQADALNKGSIHCGDGILGWINSDDRLLPGSLDHVAEVFSDHPEVLMYEGRRIIVHPDGSRSEAPNNDPHEKEALFIRPHVNQQSTFYRTSAVRAVGGFDSALHYVMDLDLWLRLLFRYGTDRLHVDHRPLAEFRLHPASKTSGGVTGFIDEQASILHGALLITGGTELASVVRSGHAIRQGLRPIDDAKGHGDLVRKMTLSFLLKWNRKIHDRKQYEVMKQLMRVASEDELIAACGASEFQAAKDRLAAPTWTLYRARRKWKHLFG